MRLPFLLDCKKLYATELQFSNIWREDLLDLAENGFAAKFENKKWDGLLRVAIIGAGPAGG